MLLNCGQCLSCLSADLTSSAEDREVSQLTPSDEITFTQSCDLDLHQPIESEREVEPVAMDDQEVLIDEEAIKQSMELSQRISKVAIGEECLSLWHAICTNLSRSPSAIF